MNATQAERRSIDPRYLMTKECLKDDFNVVRCSAGCPHDHAYAVTDGMEGFCHFKCKRCPWESHGRHKNHYLVHRRECKGRISVADPGTSFDAPSLFLLIEKYLVHPLKPLVHP